LRIVDLQNLRGLGDIGCDFTGEYSVEGISSQATVLFGKHAVEVVERGKQSQSPHSQKARVRYPQTKNPPSQTESGAPVLQKMTTN